MILPPLALLPALWVAPAATRMDYVIEPPGASTLQGAGSVPQLGSGLAGPSGVAMPPPVMALPAPPLPTVGVPGSSIQPGFGPPVAIVPIPQVLRPR